MRRILAICTSHIGGVLLITPALELLHRFYPQAEISVLVRKGTDAVLENNPLIKQVYIDGEITSNQRMHERTKSSLGKRFSQIPTGLKLVRVLRRQRFDLAVDFSGGDRGAILAFLSGSRERIGYQSKRAFIGKRHMYTRLFARSPEPVHKVLEHAELVLQFAACEGASRAPVGPLVLKCSPENLAWAESEWQQSAHGNGPRVLIHPTSRVAYKCWDSKKWVEVIGQLQKNFDARLMVTCSPDPKEIAMAETIVKGCPVAPAARLGGLNLGQLAALIQKADLFLGVDSAPMHIAAAVGTPVVALFGPSNDAQWAPWGEGHRVVRHPCSCLASKKVSCSPEKGMDCLNQISAEEFYRETVTILSRIPMAAAVAADSCSPSA
jgi:heptosyltransferase III